MKNDFTQGVGVGSTQTVMDRIDAVVASVVERERSGKTVDYHQSINQILALAETFDRGSMHRLTAMDKIKGIIFEERGPDEVRPDNVKSKLGCFNAAHYLVEANKLYFTSQCSELERQYPQIQGLLHAALENGEQCQQAVVEKVFSTLEVFVPKKVNNGGQSVDHPFWGDAKNYTDSISSSTAMDRHVVIA